MFRISVALISPPASHIISQWLNMHEVNNDHDIIEANIHTETQTYSSNRHRNKVAIITPLSKTLNRHNESQIVLL